MRTAGADRAAAALAAKQHGAVGRRQAASIGLSHEAIASRLRIGVLNEPVPGVLTVAAAPVTWRQRLITPTLIRPGGVVASHRSAGRLHGFDGFQEPEIEVTVAAGRFPRLQGVVVHRDGAWDERDHTVVDGIL